VALGEIEHYTQARIGNVHAPETTGKFAAAQAPPKKPVRNASPLSHVPAVKPEGFVWDASQEIE